MKILKKILSIGAWTMCAGLAMTVSSAALAADESTHAFSNEPALPSIMPEGWEQDPLSYEAGTQGADLVLTLDQQLYPALQPMIQAYGREHGLNIVVGNGTCGISAGKLGRRQVDVGGFCCPPGRMDRLPGLEFHTIGIAAVALITHQDNTLQNLTLTQARGVFSGEVERWSELHDARGRGGPAQLIQPVGRLHCKKRPGHWRLLLNRADMFSPSLIEVGAIPDMIAMVAETSAAVGYESLWMLRHYKDKGRVNVLSIDGVHPTDQAALLEGRYPFYRTYGITSWSEGGAARPEARALVAYLLEQAPRIDGEYGIVPHQALRQAGWRFRGNELIGAPDTP